ncbi:hypothetical protein BKA69DRAFT_797347 [Paraphysoderma sedebokerense]|nr:hypothetical protein BKA69DRAFT_797347 [Paraphysoderma sedebokerense]
MQTCNFTLQKLPRRAMAYKLLPIIPYDLGLRLQSETVKNRIAFSDSESSHPRIMSNNIDILYLLQHKPVYTAGRRIKNSLDTEGKRLKQFGADYVEVQRGGQVTFHGPGQLVGYPIMNLKDLQISVRCYVDGLERFIINLCKEVYSIDVKTTENTGVWVEDAKIAALGVQVSKYVTSHGFAINCNTDLSWFNHIIPCGLPDKTVTSITKEVLRNKTLRERFGPDVTIHDAIPHVLRQFGKIYNAEMIPLNELDSDWNSYVDRLVGLEA